jgi:hypothetical protein
MNGRFEPFPFQALWGNHWAKVHGFNRRLFVSMQIGPFSGFMWGSETSLPEEARGAF